MNLGNSVRYETNEQLGTSGVSSVFKGTDIKTKQDVVIKKLRSYFATEDQGLNAFLEEMDLVTQLKHPNIVPVKAVENLEQKPNLPHTSSLESTPHPETPDPRESASDPEMPDPREGWVRTTRCFLGVSDS